MLTTAQAAERLGVKPATLYAYVSRGQLTRHLAPGGRRSLFARDEVERLAARSRRGGRAGTLEIVVETELTLLDPDGAISYRGQDATRLARESTYEAVAELLWDADAAASGAAASGETAAAGGRAAAGGAAAGGAAAGGAAAGGAAAGGAAADGAAADGAAADGAAADGAAADGETAAAALAGGAAARGGVAVAGGAPWVAAEGDFAAAASGARPADRLRVIVALAAAADPLRADLRPPAVRHAARGLIAAMVDGMEPRSEPVDGTIAARLWSRLHPASPTPERLRALDGALILLADHELALSALAARVAASAHADPYLVVLAGLCAQGGALHGAAGTAVERLLAEIPDAQAVASVLGERMAAGEALPGFGHVVYRGEDPRARALLALIEAAQPDPARLDVLHAVLETAGRHEGPKPNIDLALGALTDCLGLEPGSAEAIFAIARSAGLVAHALEEYPYRLRFRARAAYVGPERNR